jgi:hypothetical protein
MAEVTYEKLAIALETTRRTAITAPTHVVNGNQPIVPKKELHRAADRYGTLAEFYRSQSVRKSSEWSAEADADVNQGPVLANLVLAPVSAPTTPTGATLARLWTFVRSITSDNIKSATVWWGDPNVQVFQAAGAMADEFTLSADASGTDPAKMGIKGMGLFPTKVSAPTYPAIAPGPPSDMQLWIDEGSGATIGTTAITGRVISADLTVPVGTTYKYLAQGPGSNQSYSTTGRKPTHPTTKVRFELPDMTQYDEFTADTVVKVRVRINGPKIETVTSVDFYNYVEWDAVGKWDALAWGELEGTNRTIELTLEHEYDATLGSDIAVRWQNAKATL